MTGNLSFMRRKRAPRRFGKARTRGSVQAVVDETIALFHWLAWVSDQIYGPDARGAARRWVIRRVHRDGPRTVPQLAKARAIRRQSLQPVVDALARDGLVHLEANAAHARSKLVTLTRRGLELADEMDRVDALVLRAVSRGMRESALLEAAATLRDLRAHFEAGVRWRPLVGR